MWRSHWSVWGKAPGQADGAFSPRLRFSPPRNRNNLDLDSSQMRILESHSVVARQFVTSKEAVDDRAPVMQRFGAREHTE